MELKNRQYAQETDLLQEKHVLIIGCGEIGRSIMRHFIQAGIRELTMVDAASDEQGKSKVFAAQAEAERLNSAVRFHPWRTAFDKQKAQQLLRGKHIAVDAAGSPDTALLLEEACADAGLAIVSGIVQSWQLQIMVSAPHSKTLQRFYRNVPSKINPVTYSFAYSALTSLMAAEAVKYLLGTQTEAINHVCRLDLKSLDFKKFDPDSPALHVQNLCIHLTYSTGKKTLSIPAQTTVRQLIRQFEPEDVYVVVNGTFIDETRYDEALFQNGDTVLMRRNVCVGG